MCSEHGPSYAGGKMHEAFWLSNSSLIQVISPSGCMVQIWGSDAEEESSTPTPTPYPLIEVLHLQEMEELEVLLP